jgi:hypothetical protein
VQRSFADAGRTGEYDKASHGEKRIQEFKESRSQRGHGMLEFLNSLLT